MYEDLIELDGLRMVLELKGISASELSVMIGRAPSYVWGIINGGHIPKTGVIAKVCSLLECPASAVVTFHGIEYLETLKEREFVKPEKAEGVVTYQPLRQLIYDFYKDRPKEERKTLNDLFDSLPQHDVPRWLVGHEGHARNPEGKRKYVGLTPDKRTKIRNDKEVGLRTIYDICKRMRCNIDYVMAYK